MRRLMASFAPPGKVARKQREKQVAAAVDKRALVAKNRTAQLNVKVLAEIKRAFAAHCKARGLVIADVIEAFMRQQLEA